MLVLFAFSLATAAYSQSTLPALIEAQPLHHVRDGRVEGCGVRLTGGEPDKAASSWFDVSFNIFRHGVGVAQAIAYEIRRSEFAGNSRPAIVPVRSTWLKAGEGSARLGESSERGESLVYQMAIDDVLVLFAALANGEPVSLGIKRWGQRVDAVYVGAPVLSSDSRHRIGRCLDNLAVE